MGVQFWAASPAAESSDVGGMLTDLMKGRDQAIQKIVGSETKGESADERAQLKAIVGESFNFEAFARLSLGRNWGDRTESERAEFVDLCRRLIEKNYGDPKLYTKSDSIAYVGVDVDGNEAVVKTVVHYRSEESLIDYLFRKTEAEIDTTWLIYDMAIDDLRISRNNRSQFSKEIRKAGYESLVKKLSDKLVEEEQGTDGKG
jgi:phospholipid transport system substrate-binding protein